MKIPLRFLLVGSLTLLSAGCADNIANKFPEPDDFKAYPSPRTFDPPGRIYRVQPDGQTFGVKTLAITPQSGGEVRPAFSKTSDFSMNTLFNTIGVAADSLPASLKADIERKREMRIDSVNGTREWLDDTDLDSQIANALIGVKIRPDNKYYLIRETISAPNVSYTMNRSWIAGGTVETQFKDVVGAHADLKWNSDQTVQLTQTFNQPMRIWYKAEVLDIKPSLGAGPGQPPSVALRGSPKEKVNLPPDAPTSP